MSPTARQQAPNQSDVDALKKQLGGVDFSGSQPAPTSERLKELAARGEEIRQKLGEANKRYQEALANGNPGQIQIARQEVESLAREQNDVTAQVVAERMRLGQDRQPTKGGSILDNMR
jgi:multidrug resistance efflux pump